MTRFAHTPCPYCGTVMNVELGNPDPKPGICGRCAGLVTHLPTGALLFPDDIELAEWATRPDVVRVRDRVIAAIGRHGNPS